MEKMKKMKKAAGELAQLAKIGEVMWFGAGCLMVLAALNVCFFEPNILSGEPVTLSLGSVKVDVWGADFLPPGLSKVNFLVRALMVLRALFSGNIRCENCKKNPASDEGRAAL